MGIISQKRGERTMNENAELLNYVYQNSQMGVESIDRILDLTEDESFREVLKEQQKDYMEFHEKAREKLHENGYDEKGLNSFEKMRKYLFLPHINAYICTVNK